MLDDKCILITGGTGSFGKFFVKTILKKYNPRRVIVYSRDELKQFEMSQEVVDPRLEFFIGDIRDRDRLFLAMDAKVDIVVHAAALKQIPACERNPFEAIKTNVIGSQNVIDACRNANVSQVVALSTDKAASPINLYGATKLAADKLFIAANNYVGFRKTRFSVVRYGNVMSSRGSVIPLFKKKMKEGIIPITDANMTRFNITLSSAVELVIKTLQEMKGRELFVPKIPSYRIIDVAKAIAPEAKIDVIGIRAGEKIHEELITSTDSMTSVEFDDHYIIYPSVADAKKSIKTFKKDGIKANLLEQGFCYNSGNNKEFLTVEQIRELIENDHH